MLIRIEGTDLPGRSCGPAPESPGGHHNIHVAVQGRKGPHDLCGLVPGDAPAAHWELECTVVSPPPAADLRGPQIQGPPGRRFIYLSWGVVEDGGAFRMFRRAKLRLDQVPDEVMSAACRSGLLVGRLPLSDERGNPRCAAVPGAAITWDAPPPAPDGGAR